MLATKRSFICSNDARALSQNRFERTALVCFATFTGQINPGYNRKLDKRARVLLSGQQLHNDFR